MFLSSISGEFQVENGATNIYGVQDAWKDMKWTNLTENADGRIAAFVDFDWGVVATNDTLNFVRRTYRRCLCGQQTSLFVAMHRVL